MKRLFYDIETSLVASWHYSLGEQYMRHTQLMKNHDETKIICLSYAWEGDKKVETLTYDPKTKNDKKIIQTFDKLIAEADVVVGKNSNRFDNKHINTRRMIHDLPGMPEWRGKWEDLETHMRKEFYLLSYSLDHISKKLGLGGKDKMEFQDWVDIAEGSGKVLDKALAKMIKYNKKDVSDTMKVWQYCRKHFIARHKQLLGCIHCGGNNLCKLGFSYSGQTTYQQWKCKDCNGYAGRSKVETTKGGMQK